MATPSPSLKAEHESEDSTQSTADMTAFVQNLLIQMQTRFQAMSESIVGKNILFIDEMGSRIDELEQSINDLKTEMGADGATKSTPEGSKPTDESS